MQYLPKYLSAIFIMTFSFNSAIADVQLTVKNAAGVKSKISFSKKRARLNNGINESYILFKYSNEEVSIVDSTNKKAQKGLFDGVNDNSNNAHLKISLEEKGEGPKLSGYKTNEFNISFNGVFCGTVFLAKKLLKNEEVKKFLGMIEKIPAQAQYLLAQYNAMPSDCWVKGQELAKLYSENGFPLKTLNSRGIVLTEVVKVKLEKEIKSSYYKVPKDFLIHEENSRSRRQQTRTDMKAIPETSNAEDVDVVAKIEDESEEELSKFDQLKEDLKKKTSLSEKNKKRVKKLKEKFKSIFD